MMESMNAARVALGVIASLAPFCAFACSSSSDDGNAGDAGSGADAIECFVNCNGFDASPQDASAGDSASSTDAALSPYTTSFPATENPISENGKWKNGKTDGLDWGDVQTTPGLAFGTVVSSGPPYNDSTAILVGSWSDNQSAQAVVHTVAQTSSVFEEVELRLRTTIAPGVIQGYEFNFRAIADGSQYCQIVRWNGALNDFTYVPNASATGPGLHDGDVVKATAIGTHLTAYINGALCTSGDDSTFPSGNPGVGFYNQNGTSGQNADYGFSNFEAQNEP